MNVPSYSASIFDEPLRAIPLGHLDGDLVTLGDHTGGSIRGVRLHRDQAEAIRRVDPTENLQHRPAEERALIWWLANEGLLILIPERSPEQALGLVPVLRKHLDVEAESEDGYLIRVIGSPERFKASEIAAQFIPHFDGGRTLHDITELVGETLGDVGSAHELSEAALNLVTSMMLVGAASVDLPLDGK